MNGRAQQYVNMNYYEGAICTTGSQNSGERQMFKYLGLHLETAQSPSCFVYNIEVENASPSLGETQLHLSMMI